MISGPFLSLWRRKTLKIMLQESAFHCTGAGFPALADDSGLVVEALGGQPASFRPLCRRGTGDEATSASF